MIQFGMRAHDITEKGEMLTVLDSIKALGVHHIQLAMSKSFTDPDTGLGHYSAGLGHYIGEELARRNLHVAILGCYINPAHPDEEVRLREVAKFIEHLKYAKCMGADMVGTETGRFSADFHVTEETNTEKCYRRVLDSFKRITEAAEKLGVMVGVEGVYDHTLHTPELMRRFLDDIDSPNVDVIYDAVNMIAPENASPEAQSAVVRRSFALYGDRISVLHLKDCVFSGREQLFRHPGEGIFDYSELMRQVADSKPQIIGLLENSTPDRYHADCRYLQEQYDSCSSCNGKTIVL